MLSATTRIVAGQSVRPDAAIVVVDDFLPAELALSMRRDLVDNFMAALQAWATLTLGMGNVSWPYLSLYVSGCRQGLHNDAANGRFAFVYSLTRDQRRTIGGETLVFREGDPFRSRLADPSAGRSFYEVIEPKFNRLTVFDDRLPHAVERVEG